jgi:hypothetical protein
MDANVPPNESMDYFGENGERLQMMLNFPVNQRVFYASRPKTSSRSCEHWRIPISGRRRRKGEFPSQP